MIALDADAAVEDVTDGDDTVSLAGLYQTVTVTLGGGADNFTGGNYVDNVTGGTGIDTIAGGLGDDFLQGLGGADTLRGDDADDIRGGDGNDTIRGDAGADTVRGEGGDDAIYFNAGAQVVTSFGTGYTSDDALLSGGTGFDSLIGNGAIDVFDLRESRYEGPTGGFELFDLGTGSDIFIGRVGSSISYQTFIFGGTGDDVLSNFGVTTPSIDLAHIDPSYDIATSQWTINYTGATAAQSVVLTQAQIRDPDTWNPNEDLPTVFTDSPNFLTAQYVDGGTGQNARVEGSEGTDIVFGGENSADPSPAVDFDDFNYGGKGDDILVGGDGYDVYHIGRGWGDDIVIDGNTATGGFANGLILFEGFDNNGDIDLNAAGVVATGNDGVAFTNNDDGTWTIAFNDGSGSITFAGAEISEVELQDHNLVGGVVQASRVKYGYNDQGTTSAADDTYDLV